ncbi:cytochrome-c peroxidase [Aureliella helgolandensis]|uniref:Cytochrome c551 peroxidase n=1 Tax=Aureliella helgolandensis TaxID=2527968 RepID=A0A518G8U4_9BACT|nr:cytochrome c peroxidase [Aureliella helgolandensis]QDV24992.1 Cytochrome c551 peroxidase precursor [Aureliella helgolandensis]
MSSIPPTSDAEAARLRNQFIVGAPAEHGDVAKASKSLVARLRILAKRGWPLVVASVASCGIGFMVCAWSGSAPDAVSEIQQPQTERPLYVAAINRRNEPISPLVPFKELDPEIVLLGKKLFHEPALSGNGRVACSTCHIVAQGGDDGLKVSRGVNGSEGKFNAPTVLNAAYNFAQFWDGRARTLEEQLDGPITSPMEMGSSWPRIIKYLKNNDAYAAQFEQHMGGSPTEDRVREALVTYERSLITVGDRFDQWLGGDEAALNADEFNGYHLFVTMNCIACHQGPAVGGNMFQKLGRMEAYFKDQDTASTIDLGRFNTTQDEVDRHVFRVPTLRNIAMTAPFFHDGSVGTLEEAVAIMIEYQLGKEVHEEEVRRLVAFLRTLTGSIPD